MSLGYAMMLYGFYGMVNMINEMFTCYVRATCSCNRPFGQIRRVDHVITQFKTPLLFYTIVATHSFCRAHRSFTVSRSMFIRSATFIYNDQAPMYPYLNTTTHTRPHS